MLIYLAAISSDEDKSKFELIYRQYRNLMYYAANQILHNSSDAEDVVHQAFLKIVEILDTISEIKSHKTCSQHCAASQMPFSASTGATPA